MVWHFFAMGNTCGLGEAEQEGRWCGNQKQHQNEAEHEVDDDQDIPKSSGYVQRSRGLSDAQKPSQPVSDEPARCDAPVAVFAATARPPADDGIASSFSSVVGGKTYVPPVLPQTVPLIDGIERMEPHEAYRWLRRCGGGRGCVLIDNRDKDRASGIIDPSLHVAALDMTGSFWSKLPALIQQLADQELVIFTCQYSAHRGPTCANAYREKANRRQRVALLEGGFRAWEGNGLPVQGLNGHAATNTLFNREADAYALAQGQQIAKQYPMVQHAGHMVQPQAQPQTYLRQSSLQRPQLYGQQYLMAPAARQPSGGW